MEGLQNGGRRLSMCLGTIANFARVSCLKAMGVFCILDAEVQVLLMIYMVAFTIEHIWISYQEWIFGLIKKSN